MTEREFGLSAIDDIIRDSVTGRERQSVRWESFTEEFIESIKTAKVFVDCGAEYGFYIRLALKYGPADIQIYAFEPEEERYEMLRDSLSPFIKNVEVYPFALSSREHCAVGCKPGPGISLSFSGLMHDHGDIELLEAVRLDDVVRTKVDVIKMDIEGAEDQALIGMTKVLEGKPKLFIEWHPNAFYRASTMNLLAFNGYDVPDEPIESGRAVFE